MDWYGVGIHVREYRGKVCAPLEVCATFYMPFASLLCLSMYVVAARMTSSVVSASARRVLCDWIGTIAVVGIDLWGKVCAFQDMPFANLPKRHVPACRLMLHIVTSPVAVSAPLDG